MVKIVQSCVLYSIFNQWLLLYTHFSDLRYMRTLEISYIIIITVVKGCVKMEGVYTRLIKHTVVDSMSGNIVASFLW